MWASKINITNNLYMKKHFKNILTLVCCTIVFTACDREKLNPVPETFVAEATAFDNVVRIENALRGVYGTLKNGSLYGGRVVVYGDIRGEDFINETGNLVTASDVWQHIPTNSASAVERTWTQAYLTINAANVFIEGMEAKGTSIVGQTLSNNYVAEVRLIRALAYHILVQYYARPYADGNGSRPGVPLRLTAIKGPGQSSAPRATVAQVYNQIIEDLNFAEQNLPSTYPNATLNVTRAHKNTAIALKTRVYLTMQRYADVITEANKIVPQAPPFVATSGVPHAMQADPVTPFRTFTTTESIFSMPMTTTAGDFPGTQNQLAFYFYNNGSVGSAEYSLNPNGIIANQNWGPNDRRRQFIFTNPANNKRFLSKWVTAGQYTDWVPVIRWPEVLLNLAEALARTTTGVNSRALLLVNAVRQRSDASVTIVAATQQQLIDAIMLERRIEFLGEGIRTMDILRLLQPFPAKGGAPAKNPGDVGYIWPIPASELNLNPQMTDN